MTTPGFARAAQSQPIGAPSTGLDLRGFRDNMVGMENPIRFVINGTEAETLIRPDTTVLEYLRGEALLRGTKEGCAEGDCGACSVLVKRPDDENYIATNSCILLMGQMEGASLLTVEGLAQSGSDGHVVQQRMAENGSSQCGFCTPGIVSALAGLLETKPNPEDADIHEALAGNLCRCTGYRPIVEAAHAAAQQGCGELPKQAREARSDHIGNEQSCFHIPKTLSDLLELRSENPEAVLLAGGTDLSLDVAHARARWSKAILTRDVVELRTVEEDTSHLHIGGAVTWCEVLPTIEKHWPSFAALIRRFGSVQIRSQATVAGNLGTASPIGDGAPSLLALGATLKLVSAAGERDLSLDDYFIDYRVSALRADEIIRTISIPLPTATQTFRVYKISKRYDQDISTVCGAFALEMDGDTVSSARFAYGGMAAVPMRVSKAESTLVGKAFDERTLQAARIAIIDAFSPMSDMRGSAEYRALVAANLVDRLGADLAGDPVEVMAL